MKIVEYASHDELATGAAEALARDLGAALATWDNVSFAVPGGTTPGPVFDVLSGAQHLDWARVSVMLTDERWVPEDHDRSNTALVRKRLLTGPAAAAGLVPFHGPAPMEEEVAARAKALAPLLPVSVLVLGMGADMHTASLFPGAPGLQAALSQDAPALCIMAPEDQPERRVSLAGHVLAGALAKHLIVTGTEKRAALARAQHLPVAAAPIKLALNGLTVHWAE